MPDVEQLFSTVGQARFLSKLDLTKGYWQIPMAKEDRAKTAFSTRAGHFEWTRMPFGLKTSGAVFSRMMRVLLQPLGCSEIVNFIDDILVATQTKERHLQCLEALFQRMCDAGVHVKPSKCFLGYKRLTYLGFTVGEGMLKPESEKIGRVLAAEAPTTKKEVRSFLGLVSFYRRFIPNMAEKAVPLTDLTKKQASSKVKWTEECQHAFDDLKACLSSQPVCVLPDLSQEFVLRTDASDVGLGAVLLQSSDGDLRPVAYASRKLLPAEKNYSTVEKECFAVVWGIHKFEPYLYGRRFTLQTDHQPLLQLSRITPTNGRLTRWSLKLQEFEFEVQKIPGGENVGADFLSRCGQ